MKALKTSLLATAATSVLMTSAYAGGFSTEGINPGGALFNDKSFVVQGAVSYAMPQRRYTGATGSVQHPANPAAYRGTEAPILIPASGSASSDATPNYFLLSGDLKFGINEHIDCAIRGHQPYFLDNEVSGNFNGRYIQDSFKIDSVGIDGTCSYKFFIKDGYRVRLIGGVTSTDFEASRTNQATAGYLAGVSMATFPPPAPGGIPIFPEFSTPVPTESDYTNIYTFDSERGYGYRVGAAFEIPKYALRAQIIYDSAVDVKLKGKQRIFNASNTVPVVLDIPAFLDLELPQSVSVRAQSGINETTLLYAGVRWMDWSEIAALTITVPDNEFLNKVLTTGYSDGWTIEGGIQKKLMDNLSGSAGLKWDKGIGGGYTDTWSLSGGLAYDIDDNWRVSLGGSISMLTSSNESDGFVGTPPDCAGSPGGGCSSSSYRQGTDWAYGIGTRLQYSIK